MRRLLCALLVSLLPLAPARAETAYVPPEIAGLDPSEIDPAVSFIIGNMLSIYFHESGHMLISEFELPVLGREEDAVDTLSAVLLLEAEDDTLKQALRDSARGWFFSGEASTELSDEDFSDSHGLDKQRAYAMVCMIAGKEGEAFQQIEGMAEIPKERIEECGAEYESARSSWSSVLEPYAAEEGDKTKFTISYQPVKDRDLAFYRDLLKESDFLNMLPTAYSGQYKLQDGIKLTAAKCDEENAFWDPSNREVTICYELVQFYAKQYAEWISEGGATSEDSGSDGESDAAE